MTDKIQLPPVISSQIGWWDSFKITLKGQIVGLAFYGLIALALILIGLSN